jgi:hypothetical protein
MEQNILAVAREWVVGVALAIMLPMIVYYTVEVINPYHTSVEELSDRKEPVSSEERASARKAYYRTLFQIAAAVGFIAITAGNFISFAPASVIIGLILGGVFCLLLGYSVYWSYMNNVLKLVLVIIAFLMLLAQSLYRFRRRAT